MKRKWNALRKKGIKPVKRSVQESWIVDINVLEPAKHVLEIVYTLLVNKNVAVL